MRQLQRVAVLRLFIQNVALGADVTNHRHHHLFTDGINRRICYLRKELLEVIEQHLWPVRQTSKRGVDTHRPDWFLAL